MRQWQVTAIAFATLALLVTPWPGDWDAVGFASAVTRFDLASFSPHPPGYPVYVIVARALNLVARDAVVACGLASAVGASLVVWAVARLVTRSPATALLALASPALTLLGSSARSDALSLGLAGAALVLRSPIASGALLSLSLGARPSYAVLVASGALVTASALDRRGRLALLGSFAVVTALWGAWLASATGGIGRYAALTRAHLAGHFGEWGGSALTRSDLSERLRDSALAIGEALGLDATPGGVARAALWLALTVAGLRALSPRSRLALAALVLPYALAAFFTQNVAAGLRHALPVAAVITAIAASGAAWLAERAPGSKRLATSLALLAFALLARPSLTAAWTQRTVPPAGVAIARALRARHPRGETLLFGGRSARVAGWARQPSVTVVYLGEVDVTLQRLDRLPSAVYVTDEVRANGPRGRAFGEAITRCRDARVDHADACVTARRYDVLGR